MTLSIFHKALSILLLLLTFFAIPALTESALAESGDVNQSALNQAVQAYQPAPLPPDNVSERAANNSERSSGASAILPTLGAIAILTGAFLLVLWLLKKTEGSAGRPIPDSIVKTVGKTRIGAYSVFLVAVGKKLALVSASSNGLTPLTEIDDPAEVEAILNVLDKNGKKNSDFSGESAVSKKDNGGEK